MQAGGVPGREVWAQPWRAEAALREAVAPRRRLPQLCCVLRASCTRNGRSTRRPPNPAGPALHLRYGAHSRRLTCLGSPQLSRWHAQHHSSHPVQPLRSSGVGCATTGLPFSSGRARILGITGYLVNAGASKLVKGGCASIGLGELRNAAGARGEVGARRGGSGEQRDDWHSGEDVGRASQRIGVGVTGTSCRTVRRPVS